MLSGSGVGIDHDSFPREVALVGLKNPAMLTYPLSYHVVAAMRTKMIAVVCDPLRRLEKLFMYWKLLGLECGLATAASCWFGLV